MAMATATKKWTLEELHSLPDDGNKYELVRGELFVTPPPTDFHETISAKLTRILDPYVATHGLGYVYRPRAVMRFTGSEVEPDLMVRQPQADRDADWDRAPLPALIVEIFSGTTRRRDQHQKRELYLSAGVPEYWMVDPERRVVTVVRPGRPDLECTETYDWSPPGASAPLILEVAPLFA
jgi:Uma2 family endonuclease